MCYVRKAYLWQLLFVSVCHPLWIHSEYEKEEKNAEMESPYLADTLTDKLKWNSIWGIEEWIADTVTILDYPMKSKSRARYEDKKGWKYCEIEENKNKNAM